MAASLGNSTLLSVPALPPYSDIERRFVSSTRFTATCYCKSVATMSLTRLSSTVVVLTHALPWQPILAFLLAESEVCWV